jgi:hypothetical protein
MEYLKLGPPNGTAPRTDDPFHLPVPEYYSLFTGSLGVSKFMNQTHAESLIRCIGSVD